MESRKRRQSSQAGHSRRSSRTRLNDDKSDDEINDIRKELIE